VAISLGAAFGILSERGAFAGILSAGVIAFITAVFGGTRIQCSGPTAPMTAVTVMIVAFASEQLSVRLPDADVDADRFINMVFVLTGAIMVLAAVLRLGRFIMLVPKTVISGFMNGIAILIWIGQLETLFGLKLEWVGNSWWIRLVETTASKVPWCSMCWALLRRWCWCSWFPSWSSGTRKNGGYCFPARSSRLW
jgi:SulP family sulfate permease